MIYLYAVTEPDAPLPEVAGLRGGRLRKIAAPSVAAVVSELESKVQPTEAALWAHEAVVEELMRHSSVLPMRFGSVVSDEAAARASLRDRGADLCAGLARVSGAVELGVRALWEPDAERPPAPVGTGSADWSGDPNGLLSTAGSAAERDQAPGRAGAGTAYLLDRLSRTQRSQALADAIHAPLAELARESTRRLLATPRLLLSGAYLVGEDAVGAFRDRVEDLDEEIDEVAIICTGPWPPYSFAPGEPTP